MSNPPRPINVFADTLQRVRAAARGVLPEGTDVSRVQVEPPRDAGHGDIATNAAMVLAKDVRRNPRELAQVIAAQLRTDSTVASADIAGPGFINLTLRPDVWTQELRRAVMAGGDYGRSDIGGGVPVNVEYVSANPTGPMHVGHGRGAVFGDALATLLACSGFKVTREYYVNDAGTQVDQLARSAYLRYREALGENIGAIPEGLYPGEYLKPVGEALRAEFGDALTRQPETKWLPIVRAKAIEMMMAIVRADLAALNIEHDIFFSERSLIEGLANEVAATIDFLRARGLIYEGHLPSPKGRRSRTGRIASRPCSVRAPSATTSIGR
jgi:arginyl-tRNA synthetase